MKTQFEVVEHLILSNLDITSASRWLDFWMWNTRNIINSGDPIGYDMMRELIRLNREYTKGELK